MLQRGYGHEFQADSSDYRGLSSCGHRRHYAGAGKSSEFQDCRSRPFCERDVRCARASPLRCVICDFAFDEDSEPDGLIMCEKVARRFPEVKIIVVSQHDNLARVKRIMMSGCSGFVSKSS